MPLVRIIDSNIFLIEQVQAFPENQAVKVEIVWELWIRVVKNV